MFDEREDIVSGAEWQGLLREEVVKLNHHEEDTR